MEIIIEGSFIDFILSYGMYLVCMLLTLAGAIPACVATGAAMELSVSKRALDSQEKRTNIMMLVFGIIIAGGLWAIALMLAKLACEVL